MNLRANPRRGSLGNSSTAPLHDDTAPLLSKNMPVGRAQSGDVVMNKLHNSTAKLSSGALMEADEDDADFNPLQLAAALEEKSTHPLANAVVSAFCGCIADMEEPLPSVRKFQVVDGMVTNE